VGRSRRGMRIGITRSEMSSVAHIPFSNATPKNPRLRLPLSRHLRCKEEGFLFTDVQVSLCAPSFNLFSTVCLVFSGSNSSLRCMTTVRTTTSASLNVLSSALYHLIIFLLSGRHRVLTTNLLLSDPNLSRLTKPP
jgi:hypothetical protein